MSKTSIDRSIAIVGIGCRFPGGIGSPRQFWEFLTKGGDAISEVPPDRWNADALFAADPAAPGRTYARRGGFLAGIADFDPEFFGISPREAAQIDPQQRLLLETAHEAMEDAGERWEDPAIRQTGVFVGVFIHDYQHMQFADRDQLSAHSGTGSAMSITANRISYVFDLKGPSVAVDTACSSSLVAVDLACKALLNGECDYALAGGVNVILKPEMTIAMSKATMLSRDGRCKSFDSRADGYVRGEGAGLVLLRRAADARRKNRVYAVIRGTGVNSDGKTPGISVPNGAAQEALTRRVLAEANVPPASVGFVEAHGTGTPVGDPIEASALGRVFCEGRSADAPLWLGSVKTNVGHLESASGVAGLIKAALCLQEREIPRNLHFESGNPAIDFEGLKLRVVTNNEPWPAQSEPRRAAVNSFGFGGTNAHVVLEETPEASSEPEAEPQTPLRRARLLLPMGAHQEGALRALSRDYAQALEKESRAQDLIFTASQRRSHGSWRAAFAAETPAELRAQLLRFADGERPKGAAVGACHEAFSGRPVFVFSGMGPQWWAMGRELLAQEPVFRAEVERIERAFAAFSGWSLLEELTREEAASRIHETHIAQPAIFAVQAGLSALWKHWGIEPAAVIGHSVGEIAALYVAGVLSLEDAARVAYHRSRLQGRTAGSGGMLAANLDAADATSLIQNLGGAVSIAAINSPTSLTLSGDDGALRELHAKLESDGVFARLLRVEVPYHSAKMDPIREDLLRELSALRPESGHCRYYSTTDAAEGIGPLGDAEYWWRNVRQTVLFSKAVTAALDDGHRCFLELGPHPVLQAAIGECLSDPSTPTKVVSSLRRGASDFESLAASIAELHVTGATLAWPEIVGAGQLLELPTYPWQRSEHWSESDQAEQYRKGASVTSARLSATPRHVLLGAKLDLPTPTWLRTLRLAEQPYLDDHKVQGSAVFPGAGYLEMALQALAEVENEGVAAPNPKEYWLLSDVEIGRALYLRAEEAVELETTRSGDRWTIHGCSGSDGTWVRHAGGRCRREAFVNKPAALALDEVKQRCDKPLPADYAYRLFRDVGLQYGPTFRGIRELWYGPQECLARLELPESLAEASARDAYLFHPALLDACLHTLFGALNLNGEDSDRRGNVFLPISVERLRLYQRPGTKLWSHARLHTRRSQHFAADISVYDESGAIVAEVLGLRCQALETPAAVAEQRQRDWLLEYEWQKSPSGPRAGKALSGRWLVLAPHVDHPLLALLEERSADYVVAVPGADFTCENGVYTLPAVAPAAFRELLTQVAKSGEPLRGVIHGWCLEPNPRGELGAAWESQELGAVSVLHLVQALAPLYESTAETTAAPALWLLTRLTQPVSVEHPIELAHSTLWGLRRVVANEHPGLGARSVDVDASHESLRGFVAELPGSAAEDELAFRGGERFVQRLRRYRPVSPTTPVGSAASAEPRMELRVQKAGDLRSISWVSLPSFELLPHEVEIEVHATGLNFKDVMKATGLFPRRLLEGNLWSHETIGMECSGRVRRVGSQVRNVAPGQEVMALAPRTFASHAVTHSALVVPNPGLSPEAAATIPVAFLTASVGLEEQARLSAGERVLIHAASGGVGHAALQIAADLGAEIFATAGSDDKRNLLRKLGVKHVFDSRSLRFAEDIREATNGEGVDVVLNSLSGEAITQSLGILRDYGRFVEIGKMDLDRDFPLGLRPFTRCLSFHAVDLDRLLAQRVETCGRILSSIHDRLLAGRLHALPVRCYPTAQATEAFQAMASAQHTGKLVVSISPSEVPIQAAAGVRLRANAAYLVTGGLGGFGFQLALWLAEHGAGHLVLLGRRGKETPGARAAEERLLALGASVQIEACDVADAEQLRAVLARVPAEKPLRGIFHAAAVLDDALLKNLELTRYQKTFAAKALGAWNLHQQTQANSLDYFMCFSSMASVLGNQGSANYCAANAFVDALAHHRRHLGLKALTVNWGVIADVGMAADEDFYRQNLERNGLQTIHSRHCLELLELLLEADRTQTTVCPIDFETWLRFNPAGREGRLSELLSVTPGDGAAARAQSAEELALRGQLAPLDEAARSALALATVSKVLASVLRMPVEKIDPSRSLTALGADSLMAIEIKNRFESVGLAISVTQLLNRNSATTLAKRLLDALGHAAANSASASHDATGDARPAAEAGSWLLNKAPRPKAALRLICFPYAGGGPAVYHHWPDSLPDSVEVLAVCLPGRGPRADESNIRSIAEAADAILPELLPLLDRPFALFGHCMGAILMYEVAQRLEARHGKVAQRLFASGCMAPHLYNSPIVHEQGNAEFLDVLRLISFSGTRALIEDAELRSSLFPLLRGDFRAVAEYGGNFVERPALSAPITGIAAENDLFAAPKAMLAWGRYTTRGYELLKLPGDHYFVESDRDTVTHIVTTRLETQTATAVELPRVQRLEPNDHTLGQIPRPTKPRRTTLRVSEPALSQRPSVLCFPGAGIPASEFPIPSSASSELDYRAIEWRALDAPGSTLSVAAAVERAFQLVTALPQRPLVFYGHCLGAIVAYELALRLEREGFAGPEHLLTAGAVGPHLYVAPDAHRLPATKLLELLRVLKYPHSARLESDLEFQGPRLALIRADFEAMSAYQYAESDALAAPITAISLRHDLWSYPLRTESWRHHTLERCEVVERDGDHYVTLRHPELIDDLLRASNARSVAAE
jgi:acyl transferase domain-containing protein/surfactin synthase thioesterase subunit/NADPH-dependent curcumin reductase CurA/NAD(P)-dependent dehydrogenase (short-subunit alcohol dehydrogenase family)/acyl carrier protein